MSFPHAMGLRHLGRIFKKLLIKSHFNNFVTYFKDAQETTKTLTLEVEKNSPAPEDPRKCRES
jgi:hypothetical protein